MNENAAATHNQGLDSGFNRKTHAPNTAINQLRAIQAVYRAIEHC